MCSPGGLIQHHGFQFRLRAKILQIGLSPDSTTADSTGRPNVPWASLTWPILCAWSTELASLTSEQLVRPEDGKHKGLNPSGHRTCLGDLPKPGPEGFMDRSSLLEEAYLSVD